MILTIIMFKLNSPLAAVFELSVCGIDIRHIYKLQTRFLYDIEEDPLALKLESVALSARDDTGQQLTLGLQISGLALRPETK